MVNNRNVSAYVASGPPPDDCSDLQRRIGQRPLYARLDVEKLAEAGRVIPWNVKAAAFVERKKFEAEDLGALVLLAVREGRYLNSQWCVGGNGAWAACDAYSIECNEFNPDTGLYEKCSFYIKFAISKAGTLVLLASLHH